MSTPPTYPDPEASPEGTTPTQSSEKLPHLEDAFIRLDTSFIRVAAIADPVKREFELIQESKRLEIPIESYRRMFETATSGRPRGLKYQVLKPFQILDQRLGDVATWCTDISLFKLATVVGQFTLLIALGSYFIEAPYRHQQAVHGAKRIIRDSQSDRYSQDRINALQFLGKNCESLVGLQARQASMPGINLNPCTQLQLDGQTLAQMPPQLFRARSLNLAYADLAGTDLQNANLQGINLAGANLEGANLEGANLQGANLSQANLATANLRNANLADANLAQANLTKARLGQANLSHANLTQAIAIQARLLWANLQAADLHGADLSGANLNRANLQGADLYQANLQQAALRYADLRSRSRLRSANVANADFQHARFWSVSELQRAQNWQQARKDDDWDTAAQASLTPRVALIRADASNIFRSYASGIQAVSGIELIDRTLARPGVVAEAQLIQALIQQKVDVMLLRPEDPNRSVPAIKAAYDAGVVVVTIGDCINPADAARYVFACYESDSFRMGYDVTQYLVKSMPSALPGQPLNLGVLDSVKLGRAYPYFQGFEQAMQDAGVPWTETASLDVEVPADVERVKQLLKQHPETNVLWGGTAIATEAAVQAVQELGLGDRIPVYGILDLTRDQAKQLLDPHHPLHSIVDEHPQQAARAATQTALTILNQGAKPYEYHLIPHRVVGENDRQEIRELLDSLAQR